MYPKTSKVYDQWPTGAIRGNENLMDLVIEARKEKKAIRLYAVQQSGFITTLYICSKTKMYKAGQDRRGIKELEFTDHGDILYPIFQDYSFKANEKLISRVNKTYFFTEQFVNGKYGS